MNHRPWMIKKKHGGCVIVVPAQFVETQGWQRSESMRTACTNVGNLCGPVREDVVGSCVGGALHAMASLAGERRVVDLRATVIHRSAAGEEQHK